MRFLLLLLLLPTNCCLCISFRKTYSCFSCFFVFQISFLSTFIFPLFPCLSFLFYCIIYIFIPPTSFFVPWTPTSSQSTYFICSCEKSIFDRFLIPFHFCNNLLTFDWHSCFKFFLLNRIFQLPSFPSLWNTDGFDRLCW